MPLASFLRRASVAALAGEFAAEARPDVVQVPRGLAFHVPPSSVDTMFVYSLAVSLLAGNRNVVRVSPRRSATTEVLVDALNAAAADHPAVAASLAVVSYGHELEPSALLSRHADVRVIWGGDATIETIRALPLAPHATELLFGDRFSLGGPAAGRRGPGRPGAPPVQRRVLVRPDGVLVAAAGRRRGGRCVARARGALRRIDRGKLKPRRAAVLAQMAVAIHVVTITLIRRGNLARLDLERHLVKTGPGLHLVIPASEVKNNVDLEVELPPDTVKLIRWYCERHRPVLAAPGNTALFPGKGTAHKHPIVLGQQIKKLIFDRLGLTMNVHLFRHAGAKMYLDQNPGGYEIVRRVLVHKCLETTTQYYAGHETVAATRHFDAVIMARRTKLAAH